MSRSHIRGQKVIVLKWVCVTARFLAPQIDFLGSKSCGLVCLGIDILVTLSYQCSEHVRGIMRKTPEMGSPTSADHSPPR